MRINHKILSIPPYISTSWKHILSLKAESDALLVHLQDGSHITIPHLHPSIMEAIFATHAKVLETEPKTPPQAPSLSLSLELIDSPPSTLKHSPEDKDCPDLPLEVLQNILIMARTMGLQNSPFLPEEEPFCHCPHCQIVKALKSSSSELLEEDISEEDLSFNSWILQKQEHNQIGRAHV